MRKFTESIEDTGSRDTDGNWIPETTQAKLRNKLSPFWTLSDILANEDVTSKLISSEAGIKMINELANKCNQNKSDILDLIQKTDKER
jgi:hypothetical protein